VAAPVIGEDGEPMACLMVVGFNRTLSMTRLRTIGRRLSREAARISAAPGPRVKGAEGPHLRTCGGNGVKP